MHAVVETRLTAGDTLHQATDGGGVPARIEQQMDVIPHQAPGVDLHAEEALEFRQVIEITLVIVLLGEDTPAIVTALNDVMGTMRQQDPARPWHKHLSLPSMAT
jgi:hypothetical protein